MFLTTVWVISAIKLAATKFSGLSLWCLLRQYSTIYQYEVSIINLCGWKSLSMIILTFHLGRHFALFVSLIIIIIINRSCIINKRWLNKTATIYK